MPGRSFEAASRTVCPSAGIIPCFVEALREDLDRWLKRHNHERYHQRYRNMGKRPIGTVKESLEPVRKQA